MASKDGKNSKKVVPSILPVAATGNVTGVAVALAGFEAATVTLTATTASVAGTFKLTECATVGGTYTDVAAAGIIGTQGVAIVEDNIVSLGYIGVLGFIKAVFTHSADGVISADVVLDHAHLEPTGAN
tara:strand:+ start:151 stop:534 length:384 start_codon:yes stop_codon:yes gene_type:complete